MPHTAAPKQASVALAVSVRSTPKSSQTFSKCMRSAIHCRGTGSTPKR
jgi:hypothetical protein